MERTLRLRGKLGVAYLLGAPQQVQAIIITNSRGLDVTQPWPMNGEPRGTYNASTPLMSFACP